MCVTEIYYSRSSLNFFWNVKLIQIHQDWCTNWADFKVKSIWDVRSVSYVREEHNLVLFPNLWYSPYMTYLKVESAFIIIFEIKVLRALMHAWTRHTWKDSKSVIIFLNFLGEMLRVRSLACTPTLMHRKIVIKFLPSDTCRHTRAALAHKLFQVYSIKLLSTFTCKCHVSRKVHLVFGCFLG